MYPLELSIHMPQRGGPHTSMPYSISGCTSASNSLSRMVGSWMPSSLHPSHG